MKSNFLATACIAICLLTVAAKELPPHVPKPIFSDDPKGLKLPRGVPRAVDTNENVISINHDFTTPQYRYAAAKLVLQEANRVAKELQLPDEALPITESNLTEVIITPFGYNYINKRIGSVTTKRYCYYVSQDNKFCYLDSTRQAEDAYKFQESYTWPVSRMNTNEAYLLATQWLSAVSMDVKAIIRDCFVTIKPDDSYVQSPHGKFVPIYWVSFRRKGYEKARDLAAMIRSDVASVRVFTPTKTLMQMRVEDPQYILREPLVFTNLDELFPGTGRVLVFTNYPRSFKVGWPGTKGF